MSTPFDPQPCLGAGSDCCPLVVGSGCTQVGSGLYTAIQAADGTITFIDSVTGDPVLEGDIVPCPGSGEPVVLGARARQVTAGTPWTPGGDVTGTLTSVTATGVTGLWDMVDQAATALTGLPAGLTLTWSVEDNNELAGPTSITPQVGASVVVSWTER